MRFSDGPETLCRYGVCVHETKRLTIRNCAPWDGAAPCPTAGVRAGDAADPWPALAVPTTSRCARFAQRLKIGAEPKGGLVRPGNTLATCNGGSPAHRDHHAPGERYGDTAASGFSSSPSMSIHKQLPAKKPRESAVVQADPTFRTPLQSQDTDAAALQFSGPRDDPHAVQPRHIEILLLRLP